MRSRSAIVKSTVKSSCIIMLAPCRPASKGRHFLSAPVKSVISVKSVIFYLLPWIIFTPSNLFVHPPPTIHEARRRARERVGMKMWNHRLHRLHRRARIRIVLDRRLQGCRRPVPALCDLFHARVTVGCGNE